MKYSQEILLIVIFCIGLALSFNLANYNGEAKVEATTIEVNTEDRHQKKIELINAKKRAQETSKPFKIRKGVARAIVINKTLNANECSITYRNTENKTFTIPEAYPFIDKASVGDSIKVYYSILTKDFSLRESLFNQNEELKFTNIEKIIY